MPLIIRRELHFKRDGASAHCSLVACRYLNWKFLGWWLGRSGPVCVASMLTWFKSTGFLLVGPLKIIGIFVSTGWCGNCLKSNCGNMPGIWDCLQVAMRYWAEACIQAGGGHMEHLL
jgi:hypothetical protein